MGPTEADLLGRAPRQARAAMCAARLGEARRELAERHRRGEPAVQTCRRWTEAIDAVVADLLAAAGAGPPMALVAVGGYGRCELCPGSDLDLWFVVEELDQRVADVLYPLWDARLQVGHAVGDVEAFVAQAADDLTTRTALLDLRLVAGERRLHEALVARAAPLSAPAAVADLIARLEEERAARHRRLGDTVYLLEPDVKNGKGGYRDLVVAGWAAKARFGAADPGDLVARGESSQRQAAVLEEGREFLLWLRTAAHLQAGRRQDRLGFDVQEAIAAAATPGERPVAEAVEALMRRYYLHTRAVEREVTALLARCRPRAAEESAVPLDGTFARRGEELLADEPALGRDPRELTRAFRVALEQGLTLGGRLREAIADLCHGGSADGLAGDERAIDDLLAVLCDPRDRRSPSLLEEMHEAGLLSCLIPEFAPLTARVQHDLYHVYTVDQHSLLSVAFLKSIERGERTGDLPTAAQAMREVRRRRALYLATLLHDVGKPLGRGHAEAGARLVRAVARRLRLPPEEAQLAELLVRKHLTMAHLSQRRDLDDVATIAGLADELRDEERLRGLYLLTLADMATVAPGNLTAWKEGLLRELFLRALGHLRRGPDLASSDGSARVQRRKQRACARLPDERWCEGLPDRYFAATAPSQVRRHFRLSRGRPRGAVAVDLRPQPRRGCSELTVIADDTPGLLARVAGALFGLRVNILAAQIASRRTPSGREAIDVFLVQDRQGRVLEVARADEVRGRLTEALDGKRGLEDLAAGAQDAGRLPQRPVPQVPTSIEVGSSTDHTVVDVVTQDRPGVLFAITRTLSALGLDIALARVATEANRVADVFYLRDRRGRKLEESAIEEMRRELVEALDKLA